MTPKEKRNEKLAAKLIKNLERRHYNAYFSKTKEEATNIITDMIR